MQIDGHQPSSHPCRPVAARVIDSRSVRGEKAGVQAVHATFALSDEFFSTIPG
jgi:hypothetical protein